MNSATVSLFLFEFILILVRAIRLKSSRVLLSTECVDPPRDAECIQKWFAGELNPEADEANLRVPPVDYGVPHDTTTPPLSHMDPDSPDFVMSVGAFLYLYFRVGNWTDFK
jgi:hypothetical protein